MTAVTLDIVAKLWNLCNVLKDDGVAYRQYVTELTYLLFLKMAQEAGTEDQLPEGYRWGDLEAQAAPDRLEFYKILLIHLGTQWSRLVQEIFANASSARWSVPEVSCPIGPYRWCLPIESMRRGSSRPRSR